MTQGSLIFKEQRDELLNRYYAQKAGMSTDNEEEQENETEEIAESLKQIDEKLKVLEDFNNRNYKVEEGILDMWEDLYEEMDTMIVKAKFEEYTQENKPHYYPVDTWMESFRVGKVEEPTEEEKQILKEIDGKVEIKKGLGNFIINMFKKGGK